MTEQQVHAVVVWYLDPQKKIKIHVPRVYSSKEDAAAFIKLNKVHGEPKQWAIHTTICEINTSFNFCKDIMPNFK